MFYLQNVKGGWIEEAKIIMFPLHAISFPNNRRKIQLIKAKNGNLSKLL